MLAICKVVYFCIIFMEMFAQLFLYVFLRKFAVRFLKVKYFLVRGWGTVCT